MGKESITPRWTEEWERRQRGPWRRRPLPRVIPAEQCQLSLVGLLASLAVLALLAGITIMGVAKFRRAAEEADRAAHVQRP